MLGINIKNIYKVTFVIVGTIIGAGFASGQEIYTFFNVYGFKGLIGILVSVFLIGYIIHKTFNIMLNSNINNYQDFVIKIIPERLENNRLLGFTTNNIINIFLLISFNIMVAGFGSYFFQELNIPKIYGSILIAFLSFITLSKNIDGVIKINTYLIPVLILLIIFLGVKKIGYVESFFCGDTNKQASWLLSSILYASYNSISLIPILVSLKGHINTKKEVNLISFCTMTILLVLSVVIFLIMNSFIEEIKTVEIPIVYIANMLGKGFKYIYGIAILMAIFTTAISTGYGFLNNVTKGRKSYKTLLVIICIISILAGQMKFSKLVSAIYPIFGYLGSVQIFFLLNRKNTLKNYYKFDINNK